MIAIEGALNGAETGPATKPSDVAAVQADELVRVQGNGGGAKLVAVRDQSRAVQGHGVILDEIRVEGMRVVDVSHGSALCLGSHTHDTAKLRVLLEGGDTERSGMAVSSPRLHEVTFRPAFVSHENQYHARGARSLLVEMDPGSPRVRAAAAGSASNAAMAHALGSRLTGAFRSGRSERIRLTLAAIHAALDAFGAQRRPPAPSWLDATRETLAAQADHPPSLRDLATSLGVHPVYLAQSFRARWGLTTRAFVRAHRVFRAIELIEGGALLATAAAAAGFADQSHMTRAIRQARGAPPGALSSLRP